MAQFDLGSVLGAVLGGGRAAPARRRTRSAIPGVSGRGSQATLTRALAALAGAAVEALSRSGRDTPPPARQPPPPPSPLGKGRPGADLPPAKWAPSPGPWWSGPTRGTAPATGSVPQTGAQKPGPWAAPAPPLPAQAPAPSAEHAEALLLIRAMIAAAKADGVVDAEERAGIARQLDTAGLNAAERDHVLADFDRPLSAEALAKEAHDPMLAAQLYAAAYAATRAVSAAERVWLDNFGRALRLDRTAIEAIEKKLGGIPA